MTLGLTRALQRTASPPSVRASREFESARRAPPPPPRPSLSFVVRPLRTMTLDGFWKTIDEARQASGKLVDIPRCLIDTLSQSKESEIVDFGSQFEDCMDRSYDANLWLGAVVILGGCGDDRFTDFRCWLVALGREAFESALADPDSIAGLERFDGDYGDPTLFYLRSVAQRAFCKRSTGDERDFDAGMRFESLFPRREHPVLKNRELASTTYEDAKTLLPRLAARFPNGMRAVRSK
jgi:hypothetical protein